VFGAYSMRNCPAWDSAFSTPSSSKEVAHINYGVGEVGGLRGLVVPLEVNLPRFPGEATQAEFARVSSRNGAFPGREGLRVRANNRAFFHC